MSNPKPIVFTFQVKDETGTALNTLKSKFTSALSDIGKMAAAFLTRDLVQGLIRTGQESINLASQAETLHLAFETLKGGISDELLSLKTLQSATAGTVADIDLLTAANNALSLGLPTEQLNDLFNAAMTLGHAMGRTTLEAVQDVSTGIGRQSKLILDNLGIVFTAEEAYEWYAKQIGAVGRALTDNERRVGWQTYAIKMLTEKAAQLEGTTSAVQIAHERFTATIENLKTALGTRLLPAVSDIMDSFTGLMGKVLEVTDAFAVADWARGFEIIEETFKDIGDKFVEWWEDIDWIEVWDGLKDFAGTLWTKIKQWAGNIGTAFLNWFGLIDWNTVFTKASEFMEDFAPWLIDFAGDLETSLKAWVDTVDWENVFKSAAEFATRFPSWLSDQMWKLGAEIGRAFWERFFANIMNTDLWKIITGGGVVGGGATTGGTTGGGTTTTGTGGILDALQDAANAFVTGVEETIGNIGQGIATWFGNIIPFQQGGVVTKPTLAMLGERGPEAVIPLRGRGMPAEIVINQHFDKVEIHNEMDVETFGRRVSRQIGRDLVSHGFYRM